MHVRLVFRSSGPAKNSFVEIGHGHSVPTADSSRAVASTTYWRKDVHLILVNGLGSLPKKSVVKLTDGSPYVPQVPSYLKTRIIIINKY